MPRPRRKKVKKLSTRVDNSNPLAVSTRVDKSITEATMTASNLHMTAKARQLEIYTQLKRARRQRATLARKDVNEFCAFVGRDAETGDRIRQEPIHEKFQRLADQHKRLILMAHPESGKSTQIGILRLLFLLGNNPNLRIGIISKTEDNATKSTRAIRSYIEKSKELAEVFPNLVPGEVWKDNFFTVRRGVHSRDPSVQSIGLGGTIIGSRVDVMVFDDALDVENTATPAERKKVLRRIRAGFLDRLSKDGSAIFLTNAWHPEDAAHTFEDKGWPTLRVPVIDDEGEPTWPERWPLDRIDQAREDMGPLEFARAHLCKARDEGESPFDVDAMKAAQDNASDLDLVFSTRGFQMPPGAWIYHGVDLAVTKKKASHLTAITTVLLWPDGSRQLLWVSAGRWSSREIRDQILDADKRYGGTFVVENNAAQRWIIDIIMNQADLAPEDRRFPELVPFTTGKSKAHPVYGVEGLAVEIAASRWLIPVTGAAQAVKDAVELIGEMLYYTRGAHTGDRLMSLWFAREGCRKGIDANKADRKDEKDPDPFGASDPSDLPGGGVRVFDSDDSNRPPATQFG